jgi:hypothetical protein
MTDKHEKVGGILGIILFALVLIIFCLSGCKTAKPNPEHDKIIEVLPPQKPLPPCK